MEASAHQNGFGAYTTTSAALTEFTLFNELPIELRLKIWEYHLPSATILKICGRLIKRKSGKHRAIIFTDVQWGLNATSFSKNDRVPALLLACHESREVFKNKFPFSIPFRASLNTKAGAGGKLWFSAKDTIYIQNLHHLCHHPRSHGLFGAQAWLKEVGLLGIDPEYLYAYDWRAIFALLVNLKKMLGISSDDFITHRRVCPACKSDYEYWISEGTEELRKLRLEGCHAAEFELNDVSD
ncbi:hypothetical protein BDZ45DRAFT_754868 [Acephala macrosclerotiorum]|nr:hypothetical protein BDZ45DRAFT_754868 [Acephala macrosclerotiorum]